MDPGKTTKVKDSYAVIQAINDEIERSQVNSRLNSSDVERQPNSYKRPPKVYSSNRAGNSVERNMGKENHRYSTEPSKDRIQTPESAKKHIDFEEIKYDNYQYNTVEANNNNPLPIDISDEILDELSVLEREIDQDADYLTSKIRDIINSDLISLDKIQRIVSDS